MTGSPSRGFSIFVHLTPKPFSHFYLLLIHRSFPISVQNPGTSSPTELLELSLREALISVEFSAVLDEPTTPGELLSGNSSMTLSGEIDVLFPVVIDVVDVEFGLDLFIKDNNPFDGDPLSFGYELDSCSIQEATEELFEKLTDQIENEVNSVLGEGGDLPIEVNTDKLLDGLTSPLRNFTDRIKSSFSDCSDSDGPRFRRALASNSSDTSNSTAVSFEQRVRNAFESVNQTLQRAGISIEPIITPNFDPATFSAQLDISLKVTATRTAEEIKTQLSTFENVFATATNTSGDNSSALDALAVNGTDEDSVLDIDIDALLNSTVVFASFDISFEIDIKLKEMQKVFSESFADALASGLVLTISDYGADAGLVVDPIELEINFGSNSLAIRDTSFALSAHLAKTEGPWKYSVKDLIDDNFTTTALEPKPFQLSLSTEIIVDVNVSDVLTVSPMIELSSIDLIGGKLDFAFE